ncbi:MAG: hypothetical protein ACJAU8_000148 [Candidatus Paceibacteria bacterium]|jgi:hypothetical protein
MKKDYKKILWKIEEYWNKFYIAKKRHSVDISSNYKNGFSKFHPRFEQVDTFNFAESSKAVFVDDAGEYLGLQKCQVKCDTSNLSQSKLVYLIDNHNEILYPFVEICKVTGKAFDVVHIDAHPDDAEFPGEKINDLNLKNVEKYITHTRISDFFDAISDANTVGEIHRVTHSDNLEFFMPPENPYILSLDIDIFGPEGDFAELKDKVKAIASAWGGAEAVCIATSPGFIGQKFARNIIEIFTAN